jgi:hypothetical protein
MSTASALDLTADDAVVLQNSNKLAVRLLPCDVLARVAPLARQVAQFEIELAQRLAETQSPVAALERRVEPRAYERDGFVVTLWTYYASVTTREVAPALNFRKNGSANREGADSSHFGPDRNIVPRIKKHAEAQRLGQRNRRWPKPLYVFAALDRAL